MRTLMTLLTLGAACAGYVYLQPTPPPGEPYYSKQSGARLDDGSRNQPAPDDSARVPTKDLVYRLRERTRTDLDDFATQHGGVSNASADDAYQRLRLVAQSIVQAASDSDQGWDSDLAENAKPSRVPTPDPDDLQRTAFEPETDSPVLSERNADRNENHNSVRESSVPSTIPDTETAAAERPETIPQIGKSGWTETSDHPKVEASVSQVSQNGKNQVAKNQAKNAVNRAVAQWKVVGKTTEGRPMHSKHLGENGTRTLIIAGLDGKDRTAVRWLELLADEVARRPDILANNEIVFFRAGNPDGLINGESHNSRGVPLNRNFPSRRYRSTSDMPAFAVPAGEVETRVMLDTFYTFRPRRVIHLMATTGRSQVLYNKPAAQLAAEFERSSKVAVNRLDPEQLPGSLEDFADGTLEAAVMSMRLSVGNDWQKAWTTLQPHLLSIVAGQGLDDEDSTFDPDRSPIPTANVESVSRRPYRKGYEELPAPPL